MKSIIINSMITTGLAVVMLAIVVRFLLHPGYDLYFTSTVFEILGANVLIHLGLALIRKIESKYLVLEVFLDLFYTTAVLVVFGTVFEWFGAIPIGIIIAIAALIHIFTILISMVHMREESNTINKLLKKRDKEQKQNERSDTSEYQKS